MAEKTITEIEQEFKDLQTGLEAKAKEAGEAAANGIKAALEQQIGVVKALAEKAQLPEGVDLKEMNEKLAKTIDATDKLQARLKDFKVNGAEPEGKTLDMAIKEAMDSVEGKEIMEQASKMTKGTIIMPLKGKILMHQKAAMTIANTFTGDPVATYNQRQAILPGQKVNFRDLIPTAYSETGLYVTYKETASANNIAVQTEGASKAENSYTLSEVKTVNDYVAGTVTFTKQLMKSAAWMQGTLSRMLLRDFYKSENSIFFTAVSGAATGTTSGGTSPNDITQLITLIGAIKDTDFNASFCLVNNALLGRLINATFTAGYYPGAGAVTLVGQGLMIWGVPILGASWVTANRALLIDADYLERVEVEGLNLAFSFEEGNNFTKNQVTARVECFEEINLMLPQSASYMNLGAS